MNLNRPVLRYFGGKWRLAPWIISNFPGHRIYVEPFGGAASVLLRKERSYAEVYNDIDNDVVNLFRILRDTEQSQKLIDLLKLTPFSRTEFLKSYEETDCPVEAARRLIIRSFQGFSPESVRKDKRGCFRANSNRSGSTPSHDWMRFPSALQSIIERLQGVVIENRDGIEVMKAHDSADTLHYVDPPYFPSARSSGGYTHDMTKADHIRLLDALNELDGMAVLSGYYTHAYQRKLDGWARIERGALADGAQKRTECLWLNERAAAAIHDRLPDFFSKEVAHG